METETISKNGASPKSQMSRRNIIQKAFLFFSVFCVCVASSFAQDIITLKNGNDIQALVQEIGELEVKYKKFDNPNGPNYTLKKSEIFMIRYANGSKDVFNKVTDNQPPVKEGSVSGKMTNAIIDPNFELKKSSKIIINLDPSKKRASKKICSLLEKKLKELGFCCVYNNDEKDTTASSIINVHLGTLNYWWPVTTFKFQIFDKTLNKEVFSDWYTYAATQQRVIDNLIETITPYIAE